MASRQMLNAPTGPKPLPIVPGLPFSPRVLSNAFFRKLKITFQPSGAPRREEEEGGGEKWEALYRLR